MFISIPKSCRILKETRSIQIMSLISWEGWKEPDHYNSWSGIKMVRKLIYIFLLESLFMFSKGETILTPNFDSWRVKLAATPQPQSVSLYPIPSRLPVIGSARKLLVRIGYSKIPLLRNDHLVLLYNFDKFLGQNYCIQAISVAQILLRSPAEKLL